MKVNTNQAQQGTQIQSGNIFNGGISIDKDVDGRITVSGKAELSPLGKQIVAAALTGFVAALSKSNDDCIEDDED